MVESNKGYVQMNIPVLHIQTLPRVVNVRCGAHTKRMTRFLLKLVVYSLALVLGLVIGWYLFMTYGLEITV